MQTNQDRVAGERTQEQAGFEAAPCAHTPGPWEWNKHQINFELEDEHGIYPPLGETGPVAIVGGEANARLIAAAPELLAIAKEIADSGCDLGDSERRIRLYSAITKAGGEL